jgi:outer membrane biosynthesis protein TonB
MSKDSRFWRNVTLIALAHVALIAGLIRWSVEARSSSNAQSVVWLGDVGGASAATEPTTGEPPRPAKLSPSPEPRLPKSDEAEKQEPLLTAAKSEIELPIPTPTPTSAPKPTATPTSKPKATPKPAPKPTPKPTPKKPVLAKASPKAKSSPTKSAEKAKQADANAEKKKIAKAASAKNGSSSQNGTGKGSSGGKGGHAGGGKSASEFGWYGKMLHDRFYSAWIQPTTTVASGARISTLVKVRIEKDGRVSSFEIIKPSENIVVNESVAAIAKRVTQVDPVPSGLGNGDHYDVKINFELNTDQETAH